MTDEEKEEWDLKMRRMDAQVAHCYAAIEKMSAETAKLMTENRWYIPVVSAGIASGATLAIVAVVKLFL